LLTSLALLAIMMILPFPLDSLLVPTLERENEKKVPYSLNSL
jgi:hypothetical protein